MSAKSTAILVVAIVVAAFAFFLGKELMQGNQTTGKETNVQELDTPKAQEPTHQKAAAEQSYQEFLVLKKEGKSTTKELDERLTELAAQFPTNYRFPLEKIRGAAKIKGVHSHTEEFEILEESAKIAITCQCGDAEKMLADLLAHKDNKESGFWKLSTHPHQWAPIIEALEKQDAELLGKHGDHH
jgi:hypothetical protein